MINGQFGQWIDEAQQHWQHVLATGSALAANRWVSEVGKMLLIAGLSGIASSWMTSQIALARLDVKVEERMKAIESVRERLVSNRDRQISEMHADIALLESHMKTTAERQAEMFARMAAIETLLRDHMRAEARLK